MEEVVEGYVSFHNIKYFKIFHRFCINYDTELQFFSSIIWAYTYTENKSPVLETISILF